VTLEEYRADPKYKIVPTRFGSDTIDVIFRKARTPLTRQEQNALPFEEQHFFAVSSPLNRRTYEIGGDIVCHQDLEVKMRDGTVIYVDIYLPKGSGPVPVIASWSPFGKRPNDGEAEWQLMGVPPGTVSVSAKFESADPEYWCRCGYGIANVDPRGIGHSEGDAVFMGTADGRDGYDFIEWCAVQEWCNGRVALFGNSGVGMAQTRIAAECPPHLVCIAPWEATGDLFRESMREGGIRGLYAESVIGTVSGPGYIEDPLAMSDVYPHWNAYWQDKVPQFEKIKVPAYYTACWNHFHVWGSFEGFRKIKSRKKWMRAHREFEWPDTYSPQNIADLRMFYDRYLKDIRNGWEMTPRVRVEVMDAYHFDYQVNRPENEFPLARTEYAKLYLNSEKFAMSREKPASSAAAQFDGETGELRYDLKFNEETEITGFLKLHAWVSVEGHDDGDLFVLVKKLNPEGKEVSATVLGEPHPGAWGKLRISSRALDEKLSTAYKPVQAHIGDIKPGQGEIVPVDIAISPTSRIWHAGETLRLVIAGRYIREPGWFESLIWLTDNKGRINIHAGGEHDSYLQVPFIPPRYQSGGYTYR
jgi:predicted acyl esterase